nr:unnamed protein product [Callosobruchus chinensis]
MFKLSSNNTVITRTLGKADWDEKRRVQGASLPTSNAGKPDGLRPKRVVGLDLIKDVERWANRPWGDASSQRAFDEWVKTIAIELIRQTPLDAIKYLDILTIAECWKRRDDRHERDWNYNDCSPEKTKTNTTDEAMEECAACQNDCTNAEYAPTTDVWRREPPEIKNREERIPPLPSPRTPDNKVPGIPEEIEEKKVEDLMKKCQNVENYVPVKEKLFLFESLCKLGRKVRSTEDVSLKIDTTSKRARSLHDLSNLNSHIAVREICKYFENKNETQEKMPENQVVAKFKLKRTLECNNVYHRFPRAVL